MSYLLSDVLKGSACKRLNLMLRWLCREDEVDVGGWAEIPTSKLLVPLDTHMFQICRSLGAVSGTIANMSAVIKITKAFSTIAPDDPVKYDFALTRLGIRDEFSSKDFMIFFEQARQKIKV